MNNLTSRVDGAPLDTGPVNVHAEADNDRSPIHKGMVEGIYSVTVTQAQDYIGPTGRPQLC